MFKSILNKLTNYQQVPFDHNLFNLVLFLGVMIGLSSIPVNIIAGVNLLTHLVNLIVLLIYGAMYYYSRFRNMYEPLIVPLVIVTIIFLDVLWLTAGGMDSPMIFYVFLSTTCFIIFAKPHQVRIVSVLALANLSMLLLIEWKTDFVMPYPDESVRFLDFGISSIVALVLMIGLIGSLKFNYDLERQRVIERNQRIETLLRELHHRVKNNLQVISSLLGLQSNRLENVAAQRAVNEGKERIRTMSLIHQKLYQYDDVTALNIKDYIESLVVEIATSYGYLDKSEIRMDIPNMSMDADTALPLGLIINELVTNAFKYAYNEENIPLLSVSLISTQDGHFRLIVFDNGDGLPEQFDVSRANSFGFKLVQLLVKQLQGHLNITNQQGAYFEINF